MATWPSRRFGAKIREGTGGRLTPAAGSLASVIAEAQPAELPLPGGREGATVRLQPLLTGELPGPPGWFEREEGRFAGLRAMGLTGDRSEYLRIPVPAFLVEHPGVGPILIDTGLHPSVAVDPKQNFGRLLAYYYRGLKMAAEQAVPAQLRARGLDAADIRFVLMSHMHVDHASAISEFPGSTFVLSKQEWDAVMSGKTTDGYVRRQYDFGFDFRTFDFDSPGTESFATFGRSFDLFGDGSVRAVFTPGHTHGHTSFVLRLRDREVLIAVDAIYTQRTLDESVLPYKMADEHQFRRSLKEIQRYRERTPGALIIPGHDWDSFSALDPAYA
jgi:glyoxylase-like metal-dependent hydrolase (beta-lactamase superfamily II)